MPQTPVALVTGGVRGLGLAVARHLRARGELVHVVYRHSEDRARALESELGGRIHRADLLVAEDVDRLVADVVSADGRIDHAVHAVGEYESGPLADLTPDVLRHRYRRLATFSPL